MKGFLADAFGLACGVMGWSPNDFWHATPYELLAAYKAFRIFHGLDAGQGLTTDDIAVLKARLKENR